VVNILDSEIWKESKSNDEPPTPVKKEDNEENACQRKAQER
jgi:hypothetical protein